MANGTASPQPATPQNSPIDYTALAKQAGAIDSQPPAAVPTSGGVDYRALAAQNGAIDFRPAPSAPTPGSKVDYNALAAQNGAIDSQPAPSAQSQQPDLSSRIWQGVKDSTLGRIVSSALTPPQSSDEQVVHAVGGAPSLQVYRAAKSVVDSAKGMMKSASSDYGQAVNDFNRAMQDFHNQDWRNLASSATSTAADVLGATQPVMNTQAQNVRELSEGARPGGNLATPLTRQAIDAGTAAGTMAAAPAIAEGTQIADGAGIESPDTTGTAGGADSASNAATSVADRVAAQNAAKAPIISGVEAQTEAPTLESVQPQIQQGIPADTSVRDLGKALGDQFYARSKDIFAKVQQATGVDLNGLADKISTLSDKIDDAVDNPEKAGQLEQQKLSLENQADAAFTKAKNAGIDPEQARQDWKKFNAAYDFGKQVRAATDGRAGIGSGETVDPNKLAPRLQKMADSNSPTQPGRLQQFMGDDHTTSLLNNVEQGRGAIQDFKPTSATGQKALQNLVRQNTGAGKIQALKQALGGKPSTDWISTFRDFNKLSPQEQVAQFGSDAPKAQAFLKSQARWQLGKLLVKSGGALAATHITGIDRGVLHLILAE